MTLSIEHKMYRSIVLRTSAAVTFGIFFGYMAKFPIASVMKHYDEPMSDSGDNFSVRRSLFNSVNLLSLVMLCYMHARHSVNAFSNNSPKFAPATTPIALFYQRGANTPKQSLQLSRSLVLKWGTLAPIFLLALVESNVLFTESSFNDHMSWIGLGVVGATALMYVMTRCCVDEPRYSDKPASRSCMTGCR